MEYKYEKNENLKTQANKIFKGLVKNAYFAYSPNIPKQTIHDRGIIDKLNIDNNDGYLELDTLSVAFELENGAIVQFSNSEWAGIENVEIN